MLVKIMRLGFLKIFFENIVLNACNKCKFYQEILSGEDPSAEQFKLKSLSTFSEIDSMRLNMRGAKQRKER